MRTHSICGGGFPVTSHRNSAGSPSTTCKDGGSTTTLGAARFEHLNIAVQLFKSNQGALTLL